MRRMRHLCYLIFGLLLLPSSVFSQSSFDARFKAKEVVYLMRNGKYETMMLRMDTDMKRMMDEDKLMGMWDMLEMGYGKVVSVAEPELSYKGKLAVTVTVISFEKKKIGIKVIFNQKGEIAGFFLVSPTPQYTQPDYVNPASFYEYRKTLSDPKYPVNGLLTLPKRKLSGMPAVIILGGPGKADKDFTTGPNKPYKDIAWGLAENDVVVFRYDKRSAAYEGNALVQNNTSLKETYLNDLLKALALVRKMEEVDTNRIFILAHGESAYLLPYIANQLSHVAGYIALEAPFEKPLNSSNPLLLELQKQAPEENLNNLRSKKVLFVQGAKDIQTPPNQLALWKQAGEKEAAYDWSYVLYPATNYLLMEINGAPAVGDYEKAGNVAPEIIVRLASFILN